MKAVDHTFADIELPKPSPDAHDLLVRVSAVSVNPVDYKQRKQATGSRVLGWDAAGTVEEAGSAVKLFKPGDEVYYAGDVTRPGCDSELHLVDERIVGRKPKTLDFAQAAAMPLTSITAWEAFHDRMRIEGRKSMLIIGGAGGVGSIGIQLAKIAKLTVVATASRPESIAWAKSLGADHVIHHSKEMRPQLEALGLKHVDYIANFSGELDAYWGTMADVVAPQGAMVAIVGNQKPLPMDLVRSKSATLCWELMFTRSRLLNQVADMLDAGKLRCTLKETLSPINGANLRKAHDKLESGTMIGKLVLKGWS
jgi:NADPH:quinone reductase